MKHTQRSSRGNSEAHELQFCEDDRSPANIDRFFVLVADWLAAKEAATGEGHAWVGSGPVQRAGASQMQDGAA